MTLKTSEKVESAMAGDLARELSTSFAWYFKFAFMFEGKSK